MRDLGILIVFDWQRNSTNRFLRIRDVETNTKSIACPSFTVSLSYALRFLAELPPQLHYHVRVRVVCALSEVVA
jgi:hypothetical protein